MQRGAIIPNDQITDLPRVSIGEFDLRCALE
jgi:hypothetical protein